MTLPLSTSGVGGMQLVFVGRSMPGNGVGVAVLLGVLEEPPPPQAVMMRAVESNIVFVMSINLM